MAILIEKPTKIESAGNKPKVIEEFIGKVNSKTNSVSIAKMNSPEGWIEPGQTPEFDEYTLVLKGILQVKTKTDVFEVKAGQAIILPKGEWVQYSSPFPEGAEYIAVCLPAFTLESVHRDE
jgi:mannose-6-phosphate isomerase-like protein (cupin superfamily)